MTDYCKPGDVYANGLPRGAVPNPGRRAESALAATDAFELDVHGFDLNDPVVVRAEDGGVLPVPLAPNTTYYAIPLTESTFSVAAAPDGPAIDLTADGASVLVIAPLPMANAIAWASRTIDDMLTAHPVPLVLPVPPIIAMTAGELAAGKLAPRAGVVSASLVSILEAAQKRLERWEKGVPIRGENSPPRAGLAASAAVPYNDRTGWNRFGGI